MAKNRVAIRSTVLHMSAQRQWDLLSALRGPDQRGTEAAKILKDAITSRIRGIVFRVERGHFPANYKRSAITASTIDSLHLVDPAGLQKHYVDHLATAVRASKNHRVWAGQGFRIHLILGDLRERIQ